MRYYKVYVRSSRYHGTEALTYACEASLQPGTIVRVPLQRETIMGVVVEATSKPKFATRSLEIVTDLPPLPSAMIDLATKIQHYYPAPLGSLMQQFLPAKFSKSALENHELKFYKADPEDSVPSLTTEQQLAVASVRPSGMHILHGITGSGKTRVYMELADKALTAGKSAIILTPEISLTSQLAASFARAFPGRVVVLHSQLTALQREKIWLGVLTSDTPLIIVGPRSALFSPLKDLGLIVVDESHEPAYKQDQAPHYHVSVVAAMLANTCKVPLILGSATPLISDYYVAMQKDRPIIELKSLARQSEATPKVEKMIVDLKDRSLMTKSAHLSKPLVDAVQAALADGEQSLLYLNRRGTARLVLCENCGWQALCPHCDLPLTYHGDNHSLRCHTCGFVQPNIITCPTCGHPSILLRNVGTKAIADEIQHIFPEARIMRFDSDNTKSERFEQHFDSVTRGDVDIIVGTQLLAKGLDLPRLSTLGIINADSSLSIPDYSANERTYQLLSQVLGRIGRGHRRGRAVIQTYRPEHPTIQAALNGDWESFYAREIKEREQFHFPPFRYVLQLSCRRASVASAEKAAMNLKLQLETSTHGIEIEGPTPSFHEKFQSKYQWQLVVKSTVRARLLEVIAALPANWSYVIDPLDLL